jgi:hypothetical protein
MNLKQLLLDIETKNATNSLWIDAEIRCFKEPFTKAFNDEWVIGFNAYLNGDWSLALESFKKTIALAPEKRDGPSSDLIEYIEERNGVAPADWPGYR